jgi:sigma-B regulation protein RsbU (phosphoserine phosphatase)
VHLDKFWHRITEGLELSDLWKQFSTDARASFRFYRRDFDANAARETRPHKWWHTVQQLAWAILEKLSPARRVLLLFALVLLVFGGGGVTHHNEAGEVVLITWPLQFYGGALLFLLLMLEVADRVTMKRDLEIARDIQKWLLPATPPPVPGLTIAFATHAANTVAGDYYDVFSRATADSSHPHFLMAIADVAGKSIPAALLMATFQASLKTLSETPCSLAELLTNMNHYACSNSQDGRRFTTAFLAEFDPGNHTVTYINAGHNVPILRRRSGTIERLSHGGLPLGIQADASYETGKVILESGDWLVIFTDGLVEAENTKADEFGEERLLKVLETGVNATPDELLRSMMTDLDAFVGATPQHDDVTCMLIKVS